MPNMMIFEILYRVPGVILPNHEGGAQLADSIGAIKYLIGYLEGISLPRPLWPDPYGIQLKAISVHQGYRLIMNPHPAVNVKTVPAEYARLSFAIISPASSFK
ncbi:hypothetical protein [Nocardia sp. NPDC057455]|uniref:hypothetical protein n=1 Tax=Nocardia sp. NPDC057455 TaxID=3346138 RepID=UPI00366D8023